MKPLYLLFLFFCSLVSLKSQALDQNQYSTGTVIVNMSYSREIRIHISSSEGYKLKRFVELNRYRNNPELYRGCTPIIRHSAYDLTIMHQQIDSLLAKGWVLEHSNYNSAVDFSDLNDFDRERIYFQFRVPVQPVLAINNPDAHTLVSEAAVGVEQKGWLRSRLLRMNDGTHQLAVERRNGMGWALTYLLDNEGIIREGNVELITKIRVDEALLEFTCMLPDGEYIYQFRQRKGSYFLENVGFTGRDNCGVIRYELDFTVIPTSRVKGRFQAAPCELQSSGKNFSDNVARPQLQLSEFLPGTNELKVERIGEVITF